MNQQIDDSEEEEGGIKPEVLLSYVTFAGRAIRSRRWLVASVFGAIASLTVLALVLWPRSYYCETKLMTQASAALSQQSDPAVRDALQFKGAYEIIMRQE